MLLENKNAVIYGAGGAIGGAVAGYTWMMDIVKNRSGSALVVTRSTSV
ncbi:MAG: hypothetical protein ACREV2_03840 [Burkholderiales bacterium]